MPLALSTPVVAAAQLHRPSYDLENQMERWKWLEQNGRERGSALVLLRSPQMFEDTFQAPL